MKIQRPIGTYDLSPQDTPSWAWMEERIRSMFRRYNYHEIRTPVFEYTELFQRGVGESSDIVAKEMYTFPDRGDRSLTLRPEGTAPVVRAYIENTLAQQYPGAIKLWYLAPMFRYERKQKGRFRQHVQYGCEVFGAVGPDIDIEILVMLNRFYHELGLTELQLKINSVGTSECRNAYRDIFIKKIEPIIHEFCEDCRRRYQVNPLRMFDCKNERCQELLQEAPLLIDHLCDECKRHFQELQDGLSHYQIPYEIDPRLVRGLDYYTKTAFEMSYVPLGSQGVLVGGGRYDGLVEYLEGPPTPGIGFGAGMERLLLIMRETGKEINVQEKLDLFVIPLGDQALRAAGNILLEMRSAGFCCDRDYTGKSMKKQLQAADKLQARFALILGDNEIEKHVLVVKHLAAGTQQEIPWSDTLSELKVMLNQILFYEQPTEPVGLEDWEVLK